MFATAAAAVTAAAAKTTLWLAIFFLLAAITTFNHWCDGGSFSIGQYNASNAICKCRSCSNHWFLMVLMLMVAMIFQLGRYAQ